MKFLCRVLFLAACVAAGAQSNPDNAATGKTISVASIVQKQFGPAFKVTTALPRAFMTADFDSDGVEDMVIVADSTDPLPDSYAYKYDVSDPYNSFFGFGDPRRTSGFGRNDPGHNHDLLIIFGVGADAWRAATPKAKFVLINVPFDSVSVGRMLLKKGKPPIFMIKAVESQLMDSAVFWDAKKKRWRWQPGDTLE